MDSINQIPAQILNPVQLMVSAGFIPSPKQSPPSSKTYRKVSLEQKGLFFEMITLRDYSVVRAARELGIKYSTAKSLVYSKRRRMAGPGQGSAPCVGVRLGRGGEVAIVSTVGGMPDASCAGSDFTQS